MTAIIPSNGMVAIRGAMPRNNRTCPLSTSSRPERERSWYDAAIKRERFTGLDTDGAALAAEALPDVLQFMRLLWALVHGLDKTSKRMRSEVGVTGPQRMVLRVVGLFPGLSAGELAALLHVHPSTLTGVLRRLVAQRLVTRVSHRTDQRRAVLTLTTRGARINHRRRGTVEAAVEATLRGVTSRERMVASRVLERLTEQLGVKRTSVLLRSL
jgi:MarR family transcriptional regulator, organic hydroperoxide resistance regulator